MSIKTQKRIHVLEIIAIILIPFITIFICKAIEKPRTPLTTLISSEILLFNAKFEKYIGKQSGKNVKSLLAEIITSNSKNQNDRLIKVKTDKDSTITEGKIDIATDETEYINQLQNSVDNSKNFEVILSYDSDGYISEITIK